MGETLTKSNPFYKKGGLGQVILRLKDNETLEEGINRLRREGWSVPDLTQLEVKTDAEGKYIVLKGE